jgi:mRNA-degrading endonuclease RelE of RelBE toxin-antitoxin system
MKAELTQKADKQFKKLPISIKKKTIKQFALLNENLKHPSLYVKKMSGDNGIWEGRIDYHYRFSFTVIDKTIYILAIGMHDTGLGKK